jgi:hypothetical protein
MVLALLQGVGCSTFKPKRLSQRSRDTAGETCVQAEKVDMSVPGGDSSHSAGLGIELMNATT